MDTRKTLSQRNLKAISDKVVKKYDNFILEDINGDHCLRMAVMEEEYRWHYHERTDELFIVLEGRLKIEFRGRKTVFLGPGDLMKVPAWTVHKTSAAARTVNLCFEKNGADTIFVE